MVIKKFLEELHANLSVLDFIEQVKVEQRSNTHIKIKVILKPVGFLNIWYNSVTRTQSFSLILENKRKWGFDFDNREGWHEHPLENPDLHVSSKSKTIPQIIARLKQVWESVN